MERYYQEQERKRIQEKRKVEFLAEERIEAFTTVLEVGRIFAMGSSESDYKLCSVTKIKFQGPDSETLLHEEAMDPSQPASEHVSKENESLFTEFAANFKAEIDS